MSHHADALLTVRNLAVSFDGRDGPARGAGVDLSVRRGEVVCLVGESGSGKSVTGFSLMGLIDPPGRVSADELRFDGRDLLRATERERDALRGRDISMVFQEPMTALNPAHGGRADRRGLPDSRAHQPPSGLGPGGGPDGTRRHPRAGAARPPIRMSCPAACASG